jgi:hypothetical protein
MSRAGFFYWPKLIPTKQVDDTGICFQCGLALDGWEAGDDPRIEHAKRRPECPFVKNSVAIRPCSFEFLLANKPDLNAVTHISARPQVKPTDKKFQLPTATFKKSASRQSIKSRPSEINLNKVAEKIVPTKRQSIRGRTSDISKSEESTDKDHQPDTKARRLTAISKETSTSLDNTIKEELSKEPSFTLPSNMRIPNNPPSARNMAKASSRISISRLTDDYNARISNLMAFKDSIPNTTLVHTAALIPNAALVPSATLTPTTVPNPPRLSISKGKILENITSQSRGSLLAVEDTMNTRPPPSEAIKPILSRESPSDPTPRIRDPKVTKNSLPASQTKAKVGDKIKDPELEPKPVRKSPPVTKSTKPPVRTSVSAAKTKLKDEKTLLKGLESILDKSNLDMPVEKVLLQLMERKLSDYDARIKDALLHFDAEAAKLF